MAEFISFIEVASKPKTKVWEVYSGKEIFESALLGTVKWYGSWRKYAFFPEAQTLFEQQCLRDLADFCEKQTTNHRRTP